MKGFERENRELLFDAVDKGATNKWKFHWREGCTSFKRKIYLDCIHAYISHGKKAHYFLSMYEN